MSVTLCVGGSSLPPLDRDAADRQTRLMLALSETAIASTAGVVGFVSMLYRYAPERLAHVQRVAALAVATGRQLNLPAVDVAHLERAALLHDVGKIVVLDPAASKLVDWTPERSLAVRQAVAGADVLSTSAFLRPAARIVRAMCEWVDGSGQPHGLTGEAIPVVARVLGVADSLDVMTAVCRDLAWPRDLAVVELVKQAGVRFDADVVAAVLQADDPQPAAAAPWVTEPRGGVA